VDVVVARLLETAKSISSAEQHLPMLFIFGAENEGRVCPLPEIFATETNKQYFCYVLPLVLRALEADWYILVSEAWATSSTRPLKENIAVAELPLDDRYEELVAVVVKRGQKAKLFHARINNTPERRLVGEWEEKSDIKSRFVVDW